MKLFEYLPEIPDPPIEFLHDTLEKIRLNSEEAMYYPGIYGCFLVNSNKKVLEKMFEPYFPFDIEHRFGYQYIGENITIHKDMGRFETYNYIIDTGGDNVKTVWFDEDKTTILHEEVIRPRVWNKLRVDVNHGVFNLTSPRIMMMVFKQK